MSFTTVKSNSRTLFNEVQVYLNFITQEESKNPLSTSLEVKIMRGLFYVHLYSALERTVNELVQNTLILISSKSVKNKHYSFVFNTISLKQKIQSLKDCSYKKVISKSIELFEEVGSTNINNINETIFSNDLQNIWLKTIQEVRGAFGMPDMALSPKDRTTIDEIVDKRNAVAHGRETAAYIGERHNSRTLRDKLQIIQNFTNVLILDFEDYYNNKDYLKPTTKRYYA